MNLFLTLTITHFITDFMLQQWGIGVNKRGFNKYMLWHILITTFAFIIVCLSFEFTIQSSVFAGILTLVTHFVIDAVRQEIHARYKLGPSNGKFWMLLGVDQILHIFFIFVCI
ncbi:MAG: hypothetical protein UR48_C0053G0011, partial [Microgenomates group bacterium GW2011_GWD1_33_9]